MKKVFLITTILTIAAVGISSYAGYYNMQACCQPSCDPIIVQTVSCQEPSIAGLVHHLEMLDDNSVQGIFPNLIRLMLIGLALAGLAAQAIRLLTRVAMLASHQIRARIRRLQKIRGDCILRFTHHLQLLTKGVRGANVTTA